MPFYQILINAMREDKGDIEIYRFYVRLLNECPEAYTAQGYDDCKAKLREVLEID